MRMRTFRGGALATVVAFSSAWLLAGCGSGSSGGAPAPINPEAQKHTQDMLKNYGKQYSEQNRAARKKKS